MRQETTPIQAADIKKVAWASMIGTTVEWYDFVIYSQAAALIFGPLFFPALSPALGKLAGFATFGIGFVARPIGAAIFGHFGDRVGRKTTLVTTLTLMGLATLGVGFLPTYAQAGLWAPCMLVALRLVQGFAVGGEWGGAVLMAVEHAPSRPARILRQLASTRYTLVPYHRHGGDDPALGLHEQRRLFGLGLACALPHERRSRRCGPVYPPAAYGVS